MHKKFLTLEKVSVILNGKKRLKEISLEMYESSCLAVVGPSGSGKSLLAQTLKGRHFYSGRIACSFGGEDDFFHSVSLVDQHIQFKDLNNRR
jgi:molybdate transport system ATP-binding protein